MKTGVFESIKHPRRNYQAFQSV